MRFTHTRLSQIHEDIKYLQNIGVSHTKVSIIEEKYKYLHEKFWHNLQDLENAIYKIKEEEEGIIKERENIKQTKLIYDSGEYIINTTPKL
jgi:hypothetical protein